MKRVRSLGVVGAAVSAFLAVASIAPAQQVTAQPEKARPPFDYWQPEWMIRELWGPGEMPKGMRVRLLRHSTFTQFGVPKDYAGARSTASSKDAIASGAKLYRDMCAACHGKDGMGEGAPARSLLPSPALLAFMISRPIAVDEYLLWAIADGGKSFETEMPEFKTKLTRQQIWEVIAFMRAGFPSSAAAR